VAREPTHPAPVAASGAPVDAAALTGPGTLLVVEDEATVRELLAASLRFAGFSVVSVPTGTEALRAATSQRPDVVLLDVMLPDMDGFEVARRLRALSPPTADRRAGHVPILFLTARDTPEDKITGLTVGGDDYVTKPFGLEELIARIRAILRRTSGAPGNNPLVVADVRLDPVAAQVTRAGKPVALSPTEFKLLHYLMAHPNQALSKTQILHDVWHYDFGGDPSIVESYISYLRRKIDTGEPKLIHTVRGIGYALRVPRP
jgi:two-component system OmpR family response regulator